ncbi:MAG: type IIA DNA topoisomerase subunit B [Bacteroidia bacterium]|nr:type IIA DNA topoisomerase subunit B [Bacteroidia bacterium]NNC86806.1 type IIA DNA topoisomerase subunit B [Bacteroidia bacterium]NNM16426.1 type IIA DNA topoisomerase subunit B [Bacteroidia bacterium]
MAKKAAAKHGYTEASIKSLDWKEHIRLRPGMYIGKLGDGSSRDDGIYVLLKETIDNSIDEYVMGYGKRIEVEIDGDRVLVRDYGRGIPLGKLVDVVSKINTGAKYDSKAFQKSVGLNGVGTKAVNALSEKFGIQSIRDKKTIIAEFQKGKLKHKSNQKKTNEDDGTIVWFTPDNGIFQKFRFKDEYVENLLQNYTYLNTGLTLSYNGKKFKSENGLKDLLTHQLGEDHVYPIIHFNHDDVEVAMTHTNEYGEDYYSFVNGQHTTQGGTHQTAFKEAIVKAARDYYNKNFDPGDIRSSICAAISVRVQEPVFESQTKTKLGSQNRSPKGQSIRNWINEVVKKQLDNYLHKHPKVADAWLKKIQQAERERKEIAGIKKLANERAKKANLHNKKLRDCRVHLNTKHKLKEESSIFITEGDSASGSITSARDVNTQAVFSLKGKPLNCYGLTKKVVYENEEFNLLQNALNIENGLEDLRYNKVIIATDADVDGMHIRLLLSTFFLQFFPDLVRHDHLFILETPLFRVRDKQKTIYAYSEQEKRDAIEELSGKPEITRFKGLGEISPDEFKNFIGKDMRLSPVTLKGETSLNQILSYYMGKNTPQRQEFVIENLRIEENNLEVLEA